MTQLWPPTAIPHVSLLAGCARSLCCLQSRDPGLPPRAPPAPPAALEDSVPSSVWHCKSHTTLPWLCSTGTYS